MKPLISVVIPTYNRPVLVKRAAESALAQTFQQIEVIVVIDGPQFSVPIRESLKTIQDHRLKIIELPTNQHCSASRNVGVSAAISEWIAFLDDDDEWMPEKLERQLAAVQNSQYAFPIATCRLIARTDQKDLIWPRRLPKPAEPMCDYLFIRNTLFQGEGVIQTSTIFAAKALLQKLPLRIGAELHNDWEWILQATKLEGVGIEFVAEPLAVWDLRENYQDTNVSKESMSKGTDWQWSLNWARMQRELFTPRAYSSFLLSEISARAAQTGNWKVFWLLFWEAIRQGNPQIRDVFLHIGMWLMTPSQRDRLRRFVAGDFKNAKALQS